MSGSPSDAWCRYKDGSGPLHQLTERIAEAIHEVEHRGSRWEYAKDHDQWLALGSWMAAEAVTAILPIAVPT